MCTIYKLWKNRRGVSLIEILIGILIIVIASIGTLSYFSVSVGNVGRQSNRRAALERARQRLEELLETNSNLINPSVVDGIAHPVICDGAGNCQLNNAAETISVDDLPSQTLVSTVECKHDGAAGTPGGTCDVLELSAKVWFIPGPTVEDDFHRVHIQTLRTPS